MNVLGDTCTTGLSEVQSEVHSGGLINGAQDRLDMLSESHHFGCIFRRQSRERIHVTIGDNEDMTRRIGKGIQAEKAGAAAGQYVRGAFCQFGGMAVVDGIVNGCDHIAKNTGFLGLARTWPRTEGLRDTRPGVILRSADIFISPGSP